MIFFDFLFKRKPLKIDSLGGMPVTKQSSFMVFNDWPEELCFKINKINYISSSTHSTGRNWLWYNLQEDNQGRLAILEHQTDSDILYIYFPELIPHTLEFSGEKLTDPQLQNFYTHVTQKPNIPLTYNGTDYKVLWHNPVFITDQPERYRFFAINEKKVLILDLFKDHRPNPIEISIGKFIEHKDIFSIS